MQSMNGVVTRWSKQGCSKGQWSNLYTGQSETAVEAMHGQPLKVPYRPKYHSGQSDILVKLKYWSRRRTGQSDTGSCPRRRASAPRPSSSASPADRRTDSDIRPATRTSGRRLGRLRSVVIDPVPILTVAGDSEESAGSGTPWRGAPSDRLLGLTRISEANELSAGRPPPRRDRRGGGGGAAGGGGGAGGGAICRRAGAVRQAVSI